MKASIKSAAFRAAFAASLMIGAASAQPVMAQATGTPVPGIGIANLDAVIANSAAFQTAQTQRQTTYKAQMDQAEQRRSAIQSQLTPLVNKFNTDRQAATPNQQSLAQQAQSIQQIQESGQAELQRILAPVVLSQTYVTEQIEDKLDAAVKAAMAKKKVSLLLNPSAILAVNANAYNLNQDILAELNTAIPSAQLVPPAGWQPREVREAQAAQAAQGGQGAAPAAPTTSTQPQSR